MRRVYADHNATTPLDPRVRAFFVERLGELGNPSSVHAFGQAARERLERARDQVAALLGARPQELVFTASGTEANNAVLASLFRDRGGHLVVSAFEHPSILAAAAALERDGVALTRVAAAADGRVPVEGVGAALRADTRLVCLMLAQNEIGTLQPVAEVAALCRERGVAVLCDAVQGIGKVSVSVTALGVDYLTLGAHKFYGPLGAAALWLRPGAPFEALLLGGGQERRRRAGTVNVAAVAAMGLAAELAAAELDERAARMAGLRDRFEGTVLESVEDVRVHGAGAPRLPNTSNLGFSGVEAEALAIRLDLAGFAVSTGSACASGAVEPSGALLAMGLAPEEALASLRVSFGFTNRADEEEALAAAVVREVAELRRLAAV